MGVHKIKISRNNLFERLMILFFFFPYLKPRLFQYKPMINSIFTALMYFNILVIVVWIIKEKRLPNKFSIVMILLYILKIISAFANNVSVSTAVSELLLFVPLLLLCDFFLQKNALLFMETICQYMFFLITANFLYVLIVGDSGYRDATGNIVYLWQTKNHMASLYVVACALLIIVTYAKHQHFTLRSMALIAYVVFNMIYLKSSTGLLGIIVAVLLFLYSVWKPDSKLVRYDLLLIIGLAMNVAVVVFRIQDAFSWLIVDILHKDLSFTNRTYIWDLAFKFIKQKPLLGWGEGGKIYVSFISKHLLIAHNQFLEFAIVAGISACILIVVSFITLRKSLNGNDTIYSKLIIAALFAYLIMMITECVNPYQPWYILCCCVFYIDDLPAIEVKRKNKVKIRF